MNCTNLQTFMCLIVEANVVVLKKKNFCEIVTFNSYSDKVDFKKQLFFYNNKTLIDQLAFVEETQEKYATKNFMNNNDLLMANYYTHKSNLVLNRNLSVQTVTGEMLIVEHLSEDLIKEISEYINLQYSFAKEYISRHQDKFMGIQPSSDLQWYGTKSEFIELINALYEGGYVNNNERNLSKKEFFEYKAKLFKVDIENWQVIVSKQSTRENSTKFIDKLKKTLVDYYKKIFE